MPKIRNNANKARGRFTSKKTSKKGVQKVVKASVASRAVKKQAMIKKNKPKVKGNTKNEVKYYSLKELNTYFENKFNIDMDTEEDLTVGNMKYRNKYLFPHIKEGQVYKKDDIVFDETGARIYLQHIARTLDKSDDIYMEEVPFIEASEHIIKQNINKDYNILIKKSSNISTNSDGMSQGEEQKLQKHSEQVNYVDQYEIDYMNTLKHGGRSDSKKKQKKWLGKAWDIYRAVENHKKSGIFYEPYIPTDIDSHSRKPSFKWKDRIKYPITLKTIGLQLKLELYTSMSEFKHDMRCMLDNTRKYLTNNNLLKDLKSIEKHLQF